MSSQDETPSAEMSIDEVADSLVDAVMRIHPEGRKELLETLQAKYPHLRKVVGRRYHFPCRREPVDYGDRESCGDLY